MTFKSSRQGAFTVDVGEKSTARLVKEKVTLESFHISLTEYSVLAMGIKFTLHTIQMGSVTGETIQNVSSDVTGKINCDQ